MCIFAQPVSSVSETQIFGRLHDDQWQSLVYQMNFQSPTLNAMILPLPVALPSSDSESLEFISLKEYDQFFDDLDDGFPIVLPSPPSRSAVDSPVAAAAKLEVHEVGDFVASFVPTLSDFDRLDKQFRIPMESWDKIPKYADYGFAVFQLKELSGKPHPMAFRFRSRLASEGARSIFFPTVHIHDGEVHEREQFEHSLYLQAEEFDAACGRYEQRGYLVEDPATGYVRSKWLATKFCQTQKTKGIVAPNLMVHRRDLKGSLPNTDILASLFSGSSQAGGILGLPALATLAAATGLLGLKWFFDRRSTVQSEAIQPTQS